MKQGKVKWFDEKKGFGFILVEEDKSEIFVHFREIIGQGYRSLKEGQSVQFKIGKTEKGPHAEEVTVISEAD